MPAKQHRFNALALLLCALLVLAGCTGKGGETGGSEPGAPRGRYVEEELPLPDNLAFIAGIDRLEDGSLWMIGLEARETLGRSAVGDMRIWSSADDGRSWTLEDYPWLDIEGNYSMYSATFFRPGEFYFIGDFSQPPEEESGQELGEGDEEDDISFEESDEESDEGDEEEEASFGGESDTRFYRADKAGCHALDVELLQGTASGGSAFPNSIKMAGENLLFNYYKQSVLVEPETGRRLQRFDIENDAVWGSYYVQGDALAVVQPKAIHLYSLSTGELTAELPHTTPITVEQGYSTRPTSLTALAPDPDGEALFYCNSTGLYRSLLEGGATERLMDGSLTSVGMPTQALAYLFPCEDGSFLAFCQEMEGMTGRLYRYAFDPTVSSAPSQELAVYSLEDNQTVRQAMGEFQKQNADVKVTYQVGMTGDDGVTHDDALRALSTQLLAGDGPDVLVLDGLPVDSYLEKDILADLAPLLDEAVASGELLPNVAGIFRREDMLAAVPARFAVPMLHGEDLEGVDDLASLAGYVRRREPSSIRTPANVMMERFYPILSDGWFGEDGGLDEAVLTQDLIDLKAIADPVEKMDDWTWEESGQFSFGVLYLQAGLSALNFGYAYSLEDLDAAYTLIDESGRGEVELFPGGGMLLPSTILSVNASGRTEPAMAFVQTALSEAVQDYNFGDGISINAAALKKRAEQRAEGEPGTTYGTSVEDEETGEYETYILSAKNPPHAVLEENIARWGTIEAWACPDIGLRQIILDGTAAYFADDQKLEDAVADLKGKLDLYLKQ